MSPALQELARAGYCFYCDEPVPNAWDRERDHFPIADRHGGKDTVLACHRCHTLKDRVADLSEDIWSQYLRNGASRRLALCGLIHAERTSERSRRWLTSRVLQEWRDINWQTRLIVARMLCGYGAPCS